MKKSTLWIIIILIIIILIFIYPFHNYFLGNNNEKNKYMTFKEFTNSADFKNFNYEEGNIYYLKDKVINVNIYKLPKIIINDTDSYYIPKGEYEFFTCINFKSNPEAKCWLVGNRTNEFIPGKTVTFSIPVKKYGLHLWGEEYVYTIDGWYFIYLIEYYYNRIISEGIYSPITFEKQLLENNSGYELLIKTIDEVYPLPCNWSEVNFGISGWNNETPPPNLYIYNNDNQLIGIQEFTIYGYNEELNILSDKMITPNQYFKIFNLTVNNSLELGFGSRGVSLGIIKL